MKKALIWIPVIGLYFSKDYTELWFWYQIVSHAIFQMYLWKNILF